MPSRFSGYVPLTFVPLLIIAVSSAYAVINEIANSASPAASLFNVDQLVAITLLIATYIVAALAYLANNRYAEVNTSVKLASIPALLAYASAVCIIIMLSLAENTERVVGWLLAYAALCLVNAVWNSQTVIKTERVPHIFWNLVLAGLVTAVTLVAWEQASAPEVIFPIITGIALIKWWQRRRPRNFRESEAH